MKRKNIRNRIFISVILCIVIAIVILPVCTFAEQEGVVDNDCITISSGSRIQLATMDQQKHWDGTMEYSTDKIHWTTWDGGFIDSAEAADGKHYIYVRGDNNTVVSAGITWALMKPDQSNSNTLKNMKVDQNVDDTIKISGNIETLRGATGDQPATTPMGTYKKDNRYYGCYEGMFRDDQWLSSAPELTATTLAENCYCQMFQGCISLKQAPELSASTLSESCYSYMFQGCNGLTTTPDLPATTLAERCYEHMFDSCYYIKNVPNDLLSATSLKANCYDQMFLSCIRLENAPDLPATELAESCYSGMFANCYKLKSIPKELPAIDLAEYCYAGMFTHCWEVQTAPKLPATKLVEGCYSEMFVSCRSLTAPVDMSHVITLADNCCYKMYECCINLEIYNEAQPGLSKIWKATSAIDSATGWSDNMFTLTGGSFTGDPVMGTNYYIADITPTAHNVIAADVDGGYVSIELDYYIPGKTVNATDYPYKGYVTTSFVARTSSGSDIPIVNNAFTMPDSDVTVIATFKRDIKNCSISGLDESYTYTGSAIEPAVTVKLNNDTLTPDVDYTISYENNTNAGTAKLTITGKGDYAGSVSRTFTISGSKAGDETDTDDADSGNGTETNDSNNILFHLISGILSLCGACFVYKRREDC